MCKRVVDVLLIKAHDSGREDDQAEVDDVVRLMKNRIALTSDGHVSVGWDETLPSREDILDCCLPAVKWQGRSGVQPTRQFSTNYALLNDAPAKPKALNWDPDGRLAEFVALSRIVHPSAIDFEYCARLIPKGGVEWDIIPADDLPAAYTSNQRTFLLSDEWRTTAELVKRWRASGSFHNKPNHRISKALWWREKTAQEYYLDARWPFLSTAIEALVKLWGTQSKFGSKDNFVRGMRLLSEELKIEYSTQDAKLAYDIRSSFSHGQGWPRHSINSYRIRNGEPELSDDRECPKETMPLYDKTEAVLDRALKKAILDDEFRRIFLDDALLSGRLAIFGGNRRNKNRK